MYNGYMFICEHLFEMDLCFSTDNRSMTGEGNPIIKKKAGIIFAVLAAVLAVLLQPLPITWQNVGGRIL